MNRRQIGLFLTISVLVAGCQAPPAATPPATPGAPPATSKPVDPRAEAAAKSAGEQAALIDAISAAKPAAGGNASQVIGPGGTVTPPPAVAKPPAAPKPTGVVAVEAAIARASPAKPHVDDGFRPVPPIGGNRPGPAEPAATPAVPDNATAIEAPAVVAVPAEPARAAAPSADALGQDLSQKAREYPRDLAPQLDAQLYLLLKDEKVPTADALAGLNVEDRDVLTSVLDGLVNFRNGIKHDANQLITRKIRPMIEMAERLRSRSDLSIVNATLCRGIRGYGLYEPLAPARLTAGVANKPKLYYEIDNITPRLDANNMWSTAMQQDLVLYDAAGQPKWGLARTRVTDLCRNRRRDFFFACVLDLPATLPPGNYTLKITLTDAAAQRISEQSLPVTVVPAVAGNAPEPAGPPLPR